MRITEEFELFSMYLDPTFAIKSGAAKRIWPAAWIFSSVISWRGMDASLSPAVNTIWSTFPTFLNNSSISSSRVRFERSQSWPAMWLPGYEVFSFSIVDRIRAGDDDEIVRRAPDSREASATQYPIPVLR